MKHLLLVVTGSIAAYKACELVRAFVKNDIDVHVAMTKAALNFVGEITFRTLSRNPVYFDQFAQPTDWRPEHVALSDLCDAALIAPASADFLAKMVAGIADEAPLAALLAFRGPVIVAPAMNDGMWDNPTTQRNMKTLEQRGVIFVDPSFGALACGRAGLGRLAPQEDIVKTVLENLK